MQTVPIKGKAVLWIWLLITVLILSTVILFSAALVVWIFQQIQNSKQFTVSDYSGLLGIAAILVSLAYLFSKRLQNIVDDFQDYYVFQWILNNEDLKSEEVRTKVLLELFNQVNRRAEKNKIATLASIKSDVLNVKALVQKIADRTLKNL